MSFEQNLDSAKNGNLGQVLFRCSRLLNEEGVARAQALSPGFRISHTSLLPHIDLEGTRAVDLSKRLGISKQAVGQLVRELEEMGMVERRPDPSDGRAWLVVFSEKGREGLLDGLEVLRRMQTEIEEALGGARVVRLLEDLQCLQTYLESQKASGTESLRE